MSLLHVGCVVGLCGDFGVLCCRGLAVVASSLGTLLRVRGGASQGKLSREGQLLVVR